MSSESPPDPPPAPGQCQLGSVPHQPHGQCHQGSGTPQRGEVPGGAAWVPGILVTQGHEWGL